MIFSVRTLSERLGFIELSSSVMLTKEIPSAMPDDVVALFARVRFGGAASVAALEELLQSQRLEDAAQQLADGRVAVITFACTTGSLLHGPGHDVELSRRLREATGTLSTTTSTALLTALKAMGISRLAVASPYVSELNVAEQRFLEAAGVEVTAIQGLGITDDDEIARVDQATIVALAREVSRSMPDAVFLSCTNLATFGVLGTLERELGMPVLSSNSVSAWHALGLVHRSPGRAELGVLLSGQVAYPPNCAA
jgi:maleate isomerase